MKNIKITLPKTILLPKLTIYFGNIPFNLKQSKLKIDLDYENADGFYVNLNNKYYIFIEDFKNIGILVHELSHFIINIFDEKGIKILKNDETFCYYIGDYLNIILSKLKNERIIKK